MCLKWECKSTVTSPQKIITFIYGWPFITEGMIKRNRPLCKKFFCWIVFISLYLFLPWQSLVIKFLEVTDRFGIEEKKKKRVVVVFIITLHRAWWHDDIEEKHHGKLVKTNFKRNLWPKNGFHDRRSSS